MQLGRGASVTGIGLRCSEATMVTISLTVASSSKAPPWSIAPMATALSGEEPKTVTSPLSGFVSPKIMSTVVDLPAPLGPEQRDDFARRDGQIDAVHSADVGVVLAQAGQVHRRPRGHLGGPAHGLCVFHALSLPPQAAYPQAERHDLAVTTVRDRGGPGDERNFLFKN